ncbi:hypothetical protein PoB_001357600 [Plakobranchus ocellatus]|uniref:Uncharacterized protein n=1 Tax=Plakobranchus ocellatus TaxID=259542 RepID=A0AAV3YXG2_9GAST|nr:hypothetical protein PoB_001357600 [Plakobranchus ocellatus]
MLNTNIYYITHNRFSIRATVHQGMPAFKAPGRQYMFNALASDIANGKLSVEISGSNAENDVDLTSAKPKKPKRHKYWVQPGVKTPQRDGSLFNELTVSTPVIHSGCNEPETLPITDTAPTPTPSSIDEKVDL